MSASDPPSSAPNPADASAEPWLASARISQSERRLRRWFVEWRVRTALSGDETNEPQHVRVLPVPDLPPPMVRPFDTDPSGFVPGAVREAAGYATNDPTRGLRLLILADWGDGHSLVVPFSPFQEPASTGEIHTGRIDTPLAVLCPWNSRVVPIDLLRDTWWADTFDADEIEDARCAFRNCVMDEPLPPQLATRIGAPINDPGDPRVEYQTIETQIMADFLRGFQCLATGDGDDPVEPRTLVVVSSESPESSEPDVTQIDLGEYDAWASEQFAKLAAAGSQAPPPDTILVAPAHNVSISVTPEGANLCATVFDSEGEESNALNGAAIRAPDGAVIAVFTNGRARIDKCSLKNGFQIFLRDGQRVRLAERDER
jgi:hypothetical protein